MRTLVGSFTEQEWKDLYKKIYEYAATFLIILRYWLANNCEASLNQA